MKTASITSEQRWRRAWAGLCLAGAAAISGAHEKPASSDESRPALRVTSAPEASRDLLTLHRLADPAPFRCRLCRIAPGRASSAVRVSDSPVRCDDRPAELRAL